MIALGAGLLAVALAPPPAAATPGALRVGTSGDYAPFSQEVDGALRGFDVDVARAYARDRGLELRFVRFAWPALTEELVAGRFDVVMSGVTVRADRSVAGRFSVPVARSGAVALVRREGGPHTLAALDDPSVRIAVNAGGHLERATRARFPHARVRAIADNAAVPGSLRRGEVQAVVTDSLEAPHWLEGEPGWRALPPFTRDRKAYWLPAAAGARAEDLDAWLLAREADGTLARLREAHGIAAPAGPLPALPLSALVAAIDERLDLMPLVAEAKRGDGASVRVPEREARVVEAAREAVRRAARLRGAAAPDDGAVERFFRAQMAAARAVQEAVLAGPPRAGPAPPLPALRDALLRIGERMAALLVALPADLPGATVREAVGAGVDAPGLDGRTLEPIADALVALTRARRDPAAAPGGARPTGPDAPGASPAAP